VSAVPPETNPDPKATEPARFWRGTRWVVAPLLVVEAVILLWWVNQHYAVSEWLFWKYAAIWAVCLTWAVACASVGHLILRRLNFPFREHLLMSLATGVLTFGVGVFVGGILHLLGPVFFCAWPILMGAPGFLSFFRYARRGFAHLQAIRRRAGVYRTHTALFVFGCVCVLMLYVNILLPANIAYDSRWYHLAMPEHYAAAHGIVRFPEGWVMGAYPQFASLLYTWAFLVPVQGLFTRIELSAHLEFLLFVGTLAALPLLAEWLLPRTRASLAWVALFLFPGILVYDSTLNVAADHVLAFWAVPIVLTVRRVHRSMSLPHAALFGAMLGAAALTKYQALALVAGPSLFFTVGLIRALRAAPRGERLRLLRVPATVLGVLVAVTSIHWLKNLIWYGDPLYPLLRAHFHARPWVEGVDMEPVQHVTWWTPQGTLPEKLLETVKAVFTFAFIPHDWMPFHGKVPVFGFLFTGVSVLLPFVRGARRLWMVAGWTLLGIFLWYWTYHQDRYLQSLLPWMAVVTAVFLIVAWRAGLAMRVAAVTLVAAQMIWGADSYFFPTHAMLGTTPLKAVSDLIATGYTKNLTGRLEWGDALTAVAKVVPKGATVLFHERHTRLGLGAKIVTDSPGSQGGIVYDHLGSPQAVYRLLKKYHVTHVLWASGSSMDLDRYSNDLVFFDFAVNHTRNPIDIAGFTLAEMPTTEPPPPRAPVPQMAFALCKGAGKIPVADLDKALWTAPTQPTLSEADLADVSYLVTEVRCPNNAFPTTGFRQVLVRGGLGMWGRFP
jgi:hypothetical protein